MISFLLNFTYTGISFNNISVFITSLLLFVMYEQGRAKETGKKYVYHSIMPTRRRFIPKSTDKGICASYKKSRYIKISWEKEHASKSMRFHVKHNSGWPDSEGWFHSIREDSMRDEMSFVCPSPTTSRCSALWLSTMKINGHLAIKGSEADNSSGLALMTMNRFYSKTRSLSLRLCGMGNVDNKDIIFYIGKIIKYNNHDQPND